MLARWIFGLVHWGSSYIFILEGIQLGWASTQVTYRVPLTVFAGLQPLNDYYINFKYIVQKRCLYCVSFKPVGGMALILLLQA